MRAIIRLIVVLISLSAQTWAGLVWEREQLDIHAAAGEEAVNGKFVFTNTGNEPVTIESVVASCGCTTAKLEKMTYGAGEKGELPVVVKLGQQATSSKKLIYIKTKGEVNPAILRIEIYVKELVRMEPQNVYWQRGEVSPKTVRIQVIDADLRIIKVTAEHKEDSPGFKAELEVVKEGKEYKVVVTPLGTLPTLRTPITVEGLIAPNIRKNYTLYAQVKAPMTTARPLPPSGVAAPIPSSVPAPGVTPPPAPSGAAMADAEPVEVSKPTGPPIPLEGKGSLIPAWNKEFVEAIKIETTPAPLAARNLAIMQIAVYDTVNSFNRHHRPYLVEESAPKAASLEAAVASAAHLAAVGLYPSQRACFDQLLSQTLGRLPEDEARKSGVQWGESVAKAILANRIADGASTTVSYIPKTEPGQWRRTLPFMRPPDLPNWGRIKTFALAEASQFRPKGPPKLNSQRYAADFAEIKSIGGKTSTTRSAEQSLIAKFWSDFSYTSTPPGHWNDIARNIAEAKNLSLADSARMFALLNIAMADAGIAGWDAKFKYNAWRPITAIREADRDENPQTEKQSDWTPFLNTPSHPEYISGHSVFSGAAVAVLESVFGTDKVQFTIGSSELHGVTRSFESLSQAKEEIGVSRIYGGIHFRFSVEDGETCGAAVGAYVMGHCLGGVAVSESRMWEVESRK